MEIQNGAVLEDNELKEFIDNDIPKLAAVEASLLDAWKKKVARARMILLEGVRDHIVSSPHGKATPYEMWKALTDLFQNNNDQRKLALKDKLRKKKGGRDGTNILGEVHSMSR